MEISRYNRVTISVPISGTERRARQGASQRKREWHLCRTPCFLVRFKPRLEALVELRGVEPLSKKIFRPLSTYLSDVYRPVQATSAKPVPASRKILSRRLRRIAATLFH